MNETTPHQNTSLPQLSGDVFLTDAGLETSLMHDDGLELPDFAAFGLLDTEHGRAALLRYYQRYVCIAEAHGAGIVLETATWRASRDWVVRHGFTGHDVRRLNRLAVHLLLDLRASTTAALPIVVSGCIGPRLDGYAPQRRVTSSEARDYHAEQLFALAEAGADLVSALTITSADEAIGITRAAQEVGVPVVISFTVETDGRLADGTTLRRAVDVVDTATGAYPAYFMVNCAHPEHVARAMTGEGSGLQRVRALRFNASRLSHAELDEALELDAGDPAELAEQYLALRETNPHITIVGGCCGTNHEHIAEIAVATR